MVILIIIIMTATAKITLKKGTVRIFDSRTRDKENVLNIIHISHTS